MLGFCGAADVGAVPFVAGGRAGSGAAFGTPTFL